MAKTAATASAEASPVHVHAGGIDIHYVEKGQGEPLLLLHGGMVSTGGAWAGHPAGYVSHMDAFAEHFRVIAPDTRGHGRTANPSGGSISYAQLADDVLALVEVLGLDRPMICGFSDGGTIATIAAIRHPGSVRALVNDAGYDAFNPMAPSFAMVRGMLGGSLEATRADPNAAEQFFESHGMDDFLARMKADHDGAQGPGAWKAVIAQMFERLTGSPGHTFEDLRAITAPTLILTGDRDVCCSVEEAVIAYRMLSRGELAVLPGQGHYLPASAIQASIDFLRRHDR